MLIWMLAAALAQEPVSPSEADEDVDATIIVFGEAAIEQAREDVIAAMAELGWSSTRRGDSVVFTPPQSWLGKATFTPDGQMEFAGPPLLPRFSFGGLELSASDMAVADRRDACGVVDAAEDVQISGVLPSEPTGLVNVTFAAFVTAQSDRPVWSETQTLAVTRGRYTTSLGRVRPLQGLQWQAGDYALSVTAEGEREGPRVPMGSVVTTRRVDTRLGPCQQPPANQQTYDAWNPQRSTGSSSGRGGGISIGVGRSKSAPHVEAALDATAEQVSRYRAVLQETATQGRLQDLPVALDALWNHGRPLYGSQVLRTAEERRAAALELWATRASNRSGVRVAEAVEAWLAETVLYSDHPITPEEYARYEARRSDGRTLPRREGTP